METFVAVLIGSAIAWFILKVQRDAKREKEAKERQRRHLVVPEGPGVVELMRPLLVSKYALTNAQWEKLLSDYKKAGWRIVTHDPIWNIYTLEKD
jgi:hypothetical protein